MTEGEFRATCRSKLLNDVIRWNLNVELILVESRRVIASPQSVAVGDRKPTVAATSY